LTFDGLFVPDQLREAVSDRGWLRAMLEAEAALALVESRLGVIPEEAARAIREACDPDRFDVEELIRDGRNAGNVVEPLVRRLRVTSEHAHWGATSQDVLDTAAALVIRDALAVVLAYLASAERACARLAETHRGTVMAARTLLQQAVPTTFGLKAASWLVGLVHTRTRLARARLPAQLGGAGGTLASLGERGPDVLREYAGELGLAEPVVPWHTRRLPLAELGARLAVAAGWCGKIALDVQLLAQTEVGEVRERAPGPSSTMPHKRNPVGSVLVRACAEHVRAAAAVLLRAVEQEHERASGAWHTEWKALSDALAYAGGAASALAETLDGLEVDAERMRANVRPETLSEAERFAPCAREPEDYLGSADAFVDRALGFHREAGQ
jgi:3-carboxy-cis,cis-muconate cycloisomerase